MATIKSFTDFQQSKKLADILPLESADMLYYFNKSNNIPISQYPFIRSFKEKDTLSYLHCWSLASLLSALRVFTTPTAFSVKISTPSLIKTENGYKLIYVGDYTLMINNGLDTETPIESVADNPVDACVAMIEKLHELKML